MKRALVILAGLAVLRCAGVAHGQSFSRLDPGEQTVTVQTGLEGAIGTSLGYAAGLRLDAIDRTVMPFAQGTLMVARPDANDYSTRAGAQTSLFSLGWFDLSTSLALGVDGTSNAIHRATALRTDLALLAGHYGRRWFAVGEGGWDHAWMTYIHNSDYYRSFFPGVRDGWYGNSAGTFRAGLKGGVKIASAEIVLRAGVTTSERFNDLDLPFYGTVGAGWRF